MDGEEEAGDGGGDLPVQEGAAEIVGVGVVQLQNGMAGRSEAGDPVVERVVEAEIDEKPVVAVRCGCGLEIDRQQAGAALAGALGDELFDPGTSRLQTGRGNKR